METALRNLFAKSENDTLDFIRNGIKHIYISLQILNKDCNRNAMSLIKQFFKVTIFWPILFSPILALLKHFSQLLVIWERKAESSNSKIGIIGTLSGEDAIRSDSKKCWLSSIRTTL